MLSTGSNIWKMPQVSTEIFNLGTLVYLNILLNTIDVVYILYISYSCALSQEIEDVPREITLELEPKNRVHFPTTDHRRHAEVGSGCFRWQIETISFGLTHLYHPVLLGHAKETSHSARQPRQIFDKKWGFHQQWKSTIKHWNSTNWSN